MYRFFKKKSFKILLVAVAALLLLLLHTAVNGSVLLSNVFTFLTTPMQKVSASVANGTSEAVESLGTSKEELLRENEQLRQEINELNQQLSDYYQYKQENEQLKNFLELKSTNPDYQFAYGSVISRSGAENFYSFRVDKGTLDGVSVQDPVITEAGLIGWVSSVSAMQCSVTTILSPSVRIAAYDKVTRDTGILTSTADASDSGLVRLSYLEENQTVKKGDMIVTSGIGGIFPKNLRIGKAVSIASSETDVSLYATVQPYADLKNAKDVLIITQFAGQGESLPESGEDAS